MASADEAIPRAKRLKLLREAKARKERGEPTSNEAADLSDAPQKAAEPEPQALDAEQSTDDTSEEVHINPVAETPEAENVSALNDSEDEVLTLAPKRANWDIERDIAPMLRKLERRTQHAIVEILREELAAQQLEEDSSTDEEEEDGEDEEEVEEEEVDE
ncbi:unnamed protein product [Hyaloperonospora brassicae]|uniref:Coiled-coil domain-containing protein 12 n=1 Tax=Hyaloperonospora brassicae TaxID=162125 RepID=A0AAV0TSB1_HYABA|nr:unnamed protein product [Hyaloperonospora brassicae]